MRDRGLPADEFVAACYAHGSTRPVRTVIKLFRRDWGRIAIALVLFVVKCAPNWMLPLISAQIVDTIVRHDSVIRLWLSAGAIALALLLNPPVHLLYVRLMHGSVRRMSTTLRSALCHRMQVLSIGHHAGVSSGTMQAKVVRDVESVEQMVQETVDNGFGSLIILVSGLVIVAVHTPEFLLVVPLAALLVASLWRRVHALNEDYRREMERLSAGVAEITELIPVTRAHGLERTATERMDRTLHQLRSAGLRLDLLNGRFGSMTWVSLNFLGLGLLTGTALVAYYSMAGVTSADLVMLATFVALLTPNALVLLLQVPVIGKGLESVRSIAELLAAPLEDNAGRAEVRSVRGAVEFEHVSFRYAPDRPDVVRDFTLRVEPGETIALVGPSGAGKSTVLRLLIGLVRPTGGRLLLDGVDLETLDLRTYRRFVSLVPQEPILFAGTVRENVTYGMDDADDDAVRTALRDANALEFVDQLPQGMDTVIGERGARLSGGQKQRLSIARALIRDPRVLLLDEATSALDTHTEALVQEALARLVRGRTTFVVAHRLSTVRAADRIVVVRDGVIEEMGDHDELVSRGSAYARLRAAQLV